MAGKHPDHPDGPLSAFMKVLVLNISPQAQEALFHFFMVITIPLVWTGIVLGCHYLSMTQPTVYLYLMIGIALYIACQYYIIYPAKQRMKGVVHVMEQDQKEGRHLLRSKGKSSEREREMRARYNISSIDRALIFLGLVRDPLLSLPDINSLRFTLKLFSKAWMQRIHGVFYERQERKEKEKVCLMARRTTEMRINSFQVASLCPTVRY